MDSQVLQELERLTRNAAMRREDLLESGLLRSRRRKLLTITAGVMALTSAATITAFLTNLFGARGMQALAALVALGSGTISLVVTAYYADDEIVGRLAGASKYLGLRDAVYRLAIDPDSTDKQKRKGLAALQSEYTKLDETYSKYFTQGRHGTASPHHLGFDRIAAAAAAKDVQELHRNIDDEPTVR